MSALTIATVLAVIIATIKHPEYSSDFVEKTPWQMAALPFIVSLLGWMPAPIEISAINSLWSAEKKKTVNFNTADALFDFNVGYIGTAILAVFFVALGALIQYPTGQAVEAASAKYISQFVGMYASVLGEWSRYLITFIAFLCIFGTVITVIDGYSRVNQESLRLLIRQKEDSRKSLNIWMTITAIIGIVIIKFFAGQVSTMLRFAMIGSFLTTPFFALLNYVLVTRENKKSSFLAKIPRYRRIDFPLWLCYFLYLCTCHRKSRIVYKMALLRGAFCIHEKQLKISTAPQHYFIFLSLTHTNLQ